MASRCNGKTCIHTTIKTKCRR